MQKRVKYAYFAIYSLFVHFWFLFYW